MGHLRCGHCMLHSWDAGSRVPMDDRKNHDHLKNLRIQHIPTRKY